VFCHATSKVTISNDEYLQLVLQDRVGLGQLFFHLRLLPDFILTNVKAPIGRKMPLLTPIFWRHPQAGRLEDNQSLWREYRLEASGITCEIKEEFIPDLFNLDPA